VEPESAIIGDLNSDLINFYKQLRWRPRKLYEQFCTLKVSKTHYYINRRRFNSEEDRLAKAALFLYLNRLSFNGIYRTNRNGEFNVPMGSKVGEFPSEEALVWASRQLKSAQIVHGDFVESVRYVSAGDFVYLDPPYDYSGRIDRGEYGVGSFARNDIHRLKEILDLINSRGATFLLSYLATPDISSVAGQWNSKKVSVRRQVASFASNRKIVDELIISNGSLI